MNLLKTGLNEIHKTVSELKQGWDGYDGKPIDSEVIESIKCIGFISDIIKLFNKIGFAEKDIEVVPTPRGTIQFEAEKKNIYLEIEVDAEYYKRWKVQEAVAYGQSSTEKKVGRPSIISDKFREWLTGEHNKGLSSRKIAENLENMGIDIHFNTILNAIGKKEDEKDGEM
jgi:hypothetical protein